MLYLQTCAGSGHPCTAGEKTNFSCQQNFSGPIFVKRLDYIPPRLLPNAEILLTSDAVTTCEEDGVGVLQKHAHEERKARRVSGRSVTDALSIFHLLQEVITSLLQIS